MRTFIAILLVLPFGMLSAGATRAQTAASPSAQDSGKVTVSGTVPNQSTKADVLDRLRKVYGADQVIDNLAVGDVVAPAHWSQGVAKMIGPDLRQVSNGRIDIRGNAIDITGSVSNEAARQQVLSGVASAFDAHYGVKQHLDVVQSAQSVLDTTLGGRTVQFESGSAVLTPDGRTVLDEMARAIGKLRDPLVAIVGNTDDTGPRAANVQLSLERASAVKAYLVSRGIAPANLSVSGQGPDHPIASNATDAGRAKNRRTDFRIVRK